MGLSVCAYFILAATGSWMWVRRGLLRSPWLRTLHYGLGVCLVLLVLLLLGIGLVGTLGHYGTLGHSVHLPAGLAVVLLVLVSAGSATQIGAYPWARRLHVSTNALLFVAMAIVSWTGWSVVQKYLP